MQLFLSYCICISCHRQSDWQSSQYNLNNFVTSTHVYPFWIPLLSNECAQFTLQQACCNTNGVRVAACCLTALHQNKNFSRIRSRNSRYYLHITWFKITRHFYHNVVVICKILLDNRIFNISHAPIFNHSWQPIFFIYCVISSDIVVLYPIILSYWSIAPEQTVLSSYATNIYNLITRLTTNIYLNKSWQYG